AFIAFCASGDPQCPVNGAPIAGAITVRLQSNDVAVKGPAGGVALAGMSGDTPCGVGSKTTVSAGGLNVSVPVGTGRTAPLPATATITVSTANFGSDTALVTVERYAQAPVATTQQAISYFNPAVAANADGVISTRAAAVSYVNPALVPNPNGVIATRPAAVRYFNPGLVPGPRGGGGPNVRGGGFYKPAALESRRG